MSLLIDVRIQVQILMNRFINLDFVCESCAICRNRLSDPCVECQANQGDKKEEADECKPSEGTCKVENQYRFLSC